MPHTLRAIDVGDEDEDVTIAELELIVGFDDDLAGAATHIPNRLRGLRLENRTAAVAARSQLPWAHAYGRRPPPSANHDSGTQTIPTAGSSSGRGHTPVGGARPMRSEPGDIAGA